MILLWKFMLTVAAGVVERNSYGELSHLVRDDFQSLGIKGMAPAFIYSPSCRASESSTHRYSQATRFSLRGLDKSCQSPVFHWPFMLSSRRQEFYATKWSGLAFLKSQTGFFPPGAPARAAQPGRGVSPIIPQVTARTQHAAQSRLGSRQAAPPSLGPLGRGLSVGGRRGTKAGAKGDIPASASSSRGCMMPPRPGPSGLWSRS